MDKQREQQPDVIKCCGTFVPRDAAYFDAIVTGTVPLPTTMCEPVPAIVPKLNAEQQALCDRLLKRYAVVPKSNR